MPNVVTYSFGTEQLHEVVRKTNERKSFEQHRQEYADALKKAGVTNTRFEHDPDWRNSLLSCQNIGDEWRNMVKVAGAPVINYVKRVENDLFWLGFDIAAWKVGLTWTTTQEWRATVAQESNGGSSGSS